MINLIPPVLICGVFTWAVALLLVDLNRISRDRRAKIERIVKRSLIETAYNGLVRNDEIWKSKRKISRSARNPRVR